ncbi:hypothetical protein EP47_10810 [Legionella norrlandica]|uniref:F-box domain-containing protein n=2 Tax=Legionella norrlandica TaxID=1498499 RepID=A0A0A2T7E9_9GAMM|nr:hypothetical protein EP47_10810 [Legionella norrlandica]
MKNSGDEVNKEKMAEPGHTIPSQLGNFSVLPRDMLLEISSFLSNKSKAQWSQTSHGFYQFFKNDLEKEAVTELNTHVLLGNEKKALAMIASCPERLCARGTAVDYSGRTFKNVTPFQAALLSHDVTLWKKMEPYFDALPDGQAEKANQFKELFPEGLPKQESYDFSTLIQIITKSSNAETRASLDKPLDITTPLGLGIDAFRKKFTKLAMEETFFNPMHLIKAFKVYDQQYSQWNDNQCRLFLCQVIGYVQRFLPACYAQAVCQGLYLVAGENQPLRRSLIYNNSLLFYPLSYESGLGFDLGLSIECPGNPHISVGWLNSTMLEELCRANTSELLRLEHRVGQSNTDSNAWAPWSWCTIC